MFAWTGQDWQVNMGVAVEIFVIVQEMWLIYQGEGKTRKHWN
jgi:hypothetical protein